MNYKTITPQELNEKFARKEGFRLIDVREPLEFSIARIEGADLLPLSKFQEWANALDAEEEIVVMCHHGVRSANVCAFLAQKNFTKIYNLDGGIDAWSLEIDRNVPRY
jgi:rhodanese-related sulfurtransferase